MEVVVPGSAAGSRLHFSWASPTSLTCFPLGQAEDATLASSVCW